MKGTRWAATALFLAAGGLVPLLFWPGHDWPQALFPILLAGSLLAAGLAARGEPMGTGLPREFLPAFLLALLLGLAHLARLVAPYQSLSFLLLLFWSAAFLSLARGFLGHRVLLGLVLAWTVGQGGVTLLHLAGGAGGQPAGTLGSPNNLGAFFAAALGYFTGHLWGCRESVRSRMLPWGGAALATAGIMAVGSRSATLAGLALWGLLVWRGKGRARLVAAAALVALLALPNLGLHRLTAGGGGDPYAFSRWEIWRQGLELGASHPLAGVGPNLYRWVTPASLFPLPGAIGRYGFAAWGPHGDLLRAWAEGGFLGLAAVGFFLFPVFRPLAGSPRGGLSPGRTGAVLALSALLFSGLFHDLTASSAMVFLFLLFAAGSLPPAEGKEGGAPRPGLSRLPLLAMAGAALLAAGYAAVDLRAGRWGERGEALAATDPVAAVEAYSRGNAANPLHPGLAGNLGSLLVTLYGRTGKDEAFRAAASQLELASRLNRLDPAPLYRLATLYLLRAGREPAGTAADLDRAGVLLEAGLALSPRSVTAVRELARVREAQGRGEEALALLGRALADEPNYLAAHRDRERLLAGRDPDAAGGAGRERAAAEERVRGKRPGSAYEEELVR